VTLAALFQLNETERGAEIISLKGPDVMDKEQASSQAIPTAHQTESRTDGGNDDDVTLPFQGS